MLRTAALRNFLHQGPSHRRETQRPIIYQCQPSGRSRDAVRITFRGGLIQTADLSRRYVKGGLSINSEASIRSFHATPRREGPPVIALLASLLKASASLEFVRMAARVAFTFAPAVLLKTKMMQKYLGLIHKDKVKPEFAQKKDMLETKIRKGTLFYRALLIFPIALFLLTLIASLERAPLSGRWRLILLSPEEEEDIAKQLAGTGWYDAICEIISQDGPQQILPPNDWRYQWVLRTMRQLESAIPMLSLAGDVDPPEWLLRTSEEPPLPPPPKYPLRPRPSAKDMLRWFCEMTSKRPVAPAPHTIPGPPYSLLIVERPECDNAFSFGFGPDGGGGVVIYSGFIDQVVAQLPDTPIEEATEPQPSKGGFLSSIFGSVLAPGRPQLEVPEPTPEQTSELAILLAHELSHLLLSHHLETLSSATVIVPGTLSMLSDVIRVVLFPVTMLFGPFVNDAVANMGKVGSGEFQKLSEYCTSVAQEYEADAVSARLLAHAGFDARDTVRFWESRSDADKMEHTPSRASYLRLCEQQEGGVSGLARQIMGTTHPVNELRATRLRAELNRWEQKRLAALESRKQHRQRHSENTTR